MHENEILYITSDIPYPLDVGTKIRRFHLLSAYAMIGRVRLVFFYRHAQELDALEALKPLCVSFHPIPAHTMYRASAWHQVPAWQRRVHLYGTSRPFMASYHFSREMQHVVEELAPTADLVHVSRLQTVSSVETLLTRRPQQQRVVLDLDDIESIRRRRQLQHTSLRWPQRAVACFDLWRLSLYQRRMLDWFDRVLVCSHVDQAYFGSRAVMVVPNGTHVPPDLLLDESDGKTLLYVGSFSYWPNLDGLWFFLREIFPRIQQDVPEVRLLIVGRNPSPEVLALHDGKSICVAGNVPSVEAYYRQATLAIVPLRVGAGTRLKILEAFALGCPVVSTAVGCEGLETVSGQHIAVADDPPAFAQACIALMRHPQRRQSLVAHARALVQQHYTWEAIQERVASLAVSLIEEGAATWTR